jgi:hypothetical protein
MPWSMSELQKCWQLFCVALHARRVAGLNSRSAMLLRYVFTRLPIMFLRLSSSLSSDSPRSAPFLDSD